MQPVRPTILCTGPVDKSLLSRAEYKDVDIDIVNFTEITTNVDETIKQEVKEIINQKAFVVFTSSNAIRSVANCLEGRQPDWSIFCIGNTTCELAKKHFGSGMIRQTALNAAALADKIISDHSTAEVIFFCGNLRRNDLPEALRQNNFTVKEIIVYHTTLVPKKVGKIYDAVIFFSPGAAESFFQLNTLPAKTVLFVIGNTTAEIAKRYSNNKIITAEEPDKNELVTIAVKGLTRV